MLAKAFSIWSESPAANLFIIIILLFIISYFSVWVCVKERETKKIEKNSAKERQRDRDPQMSYLKNYQKTKKIGSYAARCL